MNPETAVNLRGAKLITPGAEPLKCFGCGFEHFEPIDAVAIQISLEAGKGNIQPIQGVFRCLKCASVFSIESAINELKRRGAKPPAAKD